ncbi:TIGR01212 family radical SAM protein [Butyrivibrio sp. XBB1001]|uniref:TIGR01212 family radical SAM protein n=1 Tax=Butyrivibrio sp. XBB1001 TaxID=1280682 RepID=UPI0004209A13|nr:TIGR01212 family radical SAM protein [Butyrivibrio sp. XBB1001]
MPVRLSTFLKNKYGEKVYRLALSSGCGCPNRDGTCGTGGCTFCSEGGSGEFATTIFEEAKEKIAGKTDARKFIAYYQSFTNTYGDVERLKALYTDAIKRDEVVALSLGTRPDCLGPDVMDMLKELNSIKPVWIELGLQTIHDETARRVNRGYDLPVFTDAYKRLKNAGITVIVHVILGLPGESKEMMLDTVKFLSELTPELDGIKLQNLQILKGTVMYQEFLKATEGASSDFYVMSMEEYTDLVAECIALLPDNCVVHRMQGDGPRKLLVEPLWSLDKKRVLNMLNAKTKDLLK